MCGRAATVELLRNHGASSPVRPRPSRLSPLCREGRRRRARRRTPLWQDDLPALRPIWYVCFCSMLFSCANKIQWADECINKSIVLCSPEGLAVLRSNALLLRPVGQRRCSALRSSVDDSKATDDKVSTACVASFGLPRHAGANHAIRPPACVSAGGVRVLEERRAADRRRRHPPRLRPQVRPRGDLLFISLAKTGSGSICHR